MTATVSASGSTVPLRLLGGGELAVGVDRLDELVRQIAERDAGDLFELLAVVGGDAAVEAGEA